MAGKGKAAPPPTISESPADWTELVQTRISPAAEAALEAQMKDAMAPSKSHFLRVLIYKGLGLTKEG